MRNPETKNSSDWFEKHTSPAIRKASLEFMEELELRLPPETEPQVLRDLKTSDIVELTENVKRFLGPLHKRAVNYLKEEYIYAEKAFREHEKEQAEQSVPTDQRISKNNFISEELRARMFARLNDISDAIYLDVGVNGKNSILFNNNVKEKTIKQLLAAHDFANQELGLPRERITQALAAPQPPRLAVGPVVSSAGMKYWLHELLNDDHLIQEAYYLKNCTGNPKQRYVRDIQPDEKGQVRSRLFSIRNEKGVPLFTIEYRVNPQEIWQVGDINHRGMGLLREHAFCVPFMAYLGKTLPVKSYRGPVLFQEVHLFGLRDGKHDTVNIYLTEQGPLPLEKINFDTMYVFPHQRFYLDDESFKSHIENLKRRPIRIELSDVSDALKATLTDCKADIIDFSREVNYPNLETAAGISAYSARVVYIPKLRSGHVSVDADQYETLTIPPNISVDRRKFGEPKFRKVYAPLQNFVEEYSVAVHASKPTPRPLPASATRNNLARLPGFWLALA